MRRWAVRSYLPAEPVITCFLTGATGFIGGALAAKLLAEEGVRLILLVRGETFEDATLRLRRSIARFLGNDSAAVALERAEVIVGDLGDMTTLRDSRLDVVTHVLHAAASTSLRSVREVRRTNVGGSIALAERMRRARGLVRFLYVSTAFCCGKRSDAVIHEADPLPLDGDHLVEYTRTKATCERILTADFYDLPVVVARPSIVVGHTELGCRPSGSLLWYYRAIARLGRAPFHHNDLRDVVPVDYVRDALHFLMFAGHLKHRVYHISAGPYRSARWGDLLSVFAKYGQACSPVEHCVVAPDEIVSIPQHVAEIVRDPENRERFMAAVVACARFGGLGIQCFDNTRLLSEGLELPCSFVDYLPRCLDTIGGRSIYEQMMDDE